MGQMAARGHRHAHHLVARLEQRPVDRVIGRRAGIGLHVGVLGAEQALGAIDRQLLDLVDDLVAFVIPGLRVTLAVLVGENRSTGFEHERA